MLKLQTRQLLSHLIYRCAVNNTRPAPKHAEFVAQGHYPKLQAFLWAPVFKFGRAAAGAVFVKHPRTWVNVLMAGVAPGVNVHNLIYDL